MASSALHSSTRADCGAVEFLNEALAKLGSREWIRRVRAYAGQQSRSGMSPFRDFDATLAPLLSG